MEQQQINVTNRTIICKTISADEQFDMNPRSNILRVDMYPEDRVYMIVYEEFAIE